MSEQEAANGKKPKAMINPPVFFGSAFFIAAFVGWGVAAPDMAQVVFAATQSWIIDTFGWFYVFSVAVFLIFVAFLALSSHGQIRLGPDGSQPEFSYWSWVAMLFSAGMGIGLMFFGVAEPIQHYIDPPVGAGGTVGDAREALSITFFHWGIHAWAIYAVIGLSLAYFSFRHNLPLTIRSSLYPIIGNRIYGPIGHMVDIFAVLGTMFGVATSLGFGVTQVNSGLSYLFGVEEAVPVQLILIGIITLIATGSVVAGLDGGIRRISELNLGLALVLVVFTLVVGPTLFLFDVYFQNIGTYLTEVVQKTFNLYAYQKTDWIGGWTLFYWAWWISWSPFVGMFIARVSRGRTIRQFVVGVLVVPVGLTFAWMTVFGNTAILLDMGVAAGGISQAVTENTSTALFKFFEYLPLTSITSVVATILVVTFFVTSSDSGSLVIDMLTSGGEDDAPVWQRIFWAISEGFVAGGLLLAGGLGALQTASLAAALPFSVIMLFICYGLYKSVSLEATKRESMGHSSTAGVQGVNIPWKQRLRAVVHHPSKEEAQRFLKETVRPALEQAAQEFAKNGFETNVDELEGETCFIEVLHGDERDFYYSVRLHEYEVPSFVVEQRHTRSRPQRHYFRAEIFLPEGSQGYDVMGYTQDQIIADVLSQYESHAQFLHMVRA
ncbi:choline BCCT transporter BetT [Tepidicaulis sp. LMO-SS28]|uniref:choline BCCT transporter BetT n=1 Tax=Tepidicaulis sp. LMO-SS28 TaxID=3447455 RepID=UPI003EDE8E20